MAHRSYANTIACFGGGGQCHRPLLAGVGSAARGFRLRMRGSSSLIISSTRVKPRYRKRDPSPCQYHRVRWWRQRQHLGGCQHHACVARLLPPSPRISFCNAIACDVRCGQCQLLAVSATSQCQLLAVSTARSVGDFLPSQLVCASGPSPRGVLASQQTRF